MPSLTYGQNPMSKIIENKIIEALQKKASEFQPIIMDKPSFFRDHIDVYEIVLLQTALLSALDEDEDANAVLKEIYRLTSKAWEDISL